LTVAAGMQAGLVVCCDDLTAPTKALEITYNLNTAKVEVYALGGAGLLANVAIAHSAGAVLEVLYDGTNATVLYNKTFVTTVPYAADATQVQYGMLNTNSTNVVHFVEFRDATEQDYDRYMT